MKNIITLGMVVFLLMSTTALAAGSFVYSLTLKYDGLTLTNEGLKLIEGSAPERLNQPEIGYTLKVISSGGEILHSFKFNIETLPLREPPRDIFSENGTQITVPKDTVSPPKETEIVLVIPHFTNAKAIEIYDVNNKLLLSVDIEKYSKEGGLPFDPIYIVIIAVAIVGVVTGKFLMGKKAHKEQNKHKR